MNLYDCCFIEELIQVSFSSVTKTEFPSEVDFFNSGFKSILRSLGQSVTGAFYVLQSLDGVSKYLPLAFSLHLYTFIWLCKLFNLISVSPFNSLLKSIP